MRLLSAAIAGALVAGTVLAVGATPAGARAPYQMVGPASAASGKAPGSYVSVTPFRAADATVAAGDPLQVAVGGHGGVPASNVSAVAITLATSAPTVAGGLVAYADGSPVPWTKNLLYQKGQSVAVAAISRVSAAGVLDVTNVAASGQARVTVDVSGYYVGGTLSDDPGGLHPLTTPLRLFDTRSSHGPVGAGQQVDAALGGRGGIPASGVGAVAVAISAVSPAKTGTLTAWAAGTDRPTAHTVRFTGTQNYTGFAVVPTSDAGVLSIRNDSSGPTQIVVDVVGWTSGGVSRTPGTFQPRFPNRVLAGAVVAANATTTVTVRGRGGVPLARVPAVAVSITVTTPTRAGGLVAWAGGSPVPSTTNVRFAAGGSAADFAIVPESTSGTIMIRNQSAGTAHVWVDIVGFVSADQLVPPDPSASHYLRNLSDGGPADQQTMGAEGCTDGGNGSTLVVLELGAQSIHDPLSLTTPGVLLTGTTDRRLTYAQVVDAVGAYLAGFARCSLGQAATIAVGTNNDAIHDADSYPPADRGQDWANDVIAPLQVGLPTDLAVVGADDIEASFDSTAAEAQAWENGYLSNTGVGQLIYNGSLDNCPDGFGAVHQGCSMSAIDGSVWTQDGYYSLAYGLDPARIVALPQVYTISQATQWTNVDASGGGKIKFVGALTEHAACPAPSTGCPTASLSEPNGWAALTRGLQTLSSAVDSATVPAVTDLRIDQ